MYCSTASLISTYAQSRAAVPHPKDLKILFYIKVFITQMKHLELGENCGLMTITEEITGRIYEVCFE